MLPDSWIFTPRGQGRCAVAANKMACPFERGSGNLKADPAFQQNSAPGRMKLGTAISLSALYNIPVTGILNRAFHAARATFDTCRSRHAQPMKSFMINVTFARTEPAFSTPSPFCFSAQADCTSRYLVTASNCFTSSLRSTRTLAPAFFRSSN